MPENSVAVFFSNPIRNRSNDVNYEFHQDPNFYYFTGLREPHAILLIYKDVQEFSDGTKSDEIVFLQEKDYADELWDGKRYGTLGAEKILEIDKAFANKDFTYFDAGFSDFDQVLITSIPEDINSSQKENSLHNLIKHFKLKTQKVDNINNVLLKKYTAELRQIKSDAELHLMKKAINITCEAQIELMKNLTPNMPEYESEALIEYVFKKNGAEHPGFPSIVGSGENSCVVHYNTNRKTAFENELMVVDVGAEYHGYTADVSRTLPVNGKFSEEQKVIYNIVLKAQEEGIKKCVAGNKFWEPHDVATDIIATALLELGIIDKKYKVREYFMHGTSHYLGLDVHDVGLFEPLEPGNVITVEPGIYIPKGSDCDPKWWNIGVRIEDDILITNDEPENLSERAPRTIEAIEALMKK